MMGSAEGRPELQGGAGSEDPGERIKRCDLYGGFLAEVRQESYEATGGHRLARARRPEEEHVVPAGGRYLEGAPQAPLTLQIGEVALAGG
jgi:hypothetical protein